MYKRLTSSFLKHLLFSIYVLLPTPSLKADVFAFVTDNQPKGKVAIFDASNEYNQNPLIHFGIQKYIDVGENPKYIDTPDTAWIYVVNQGDGKANSTISRIKVTDLTLQTPLNAGVYPNNIAFGGDYGFVPNRGSESVTYFDTSSPSSSTSTTNIPVGKYPCYVATNPVNNKIYVACKNSDEIWIIDPSNLSNPPQQISLNFLGEQFQQVNPTFIAFANDGTAYVACDGYTLNPTRHYIFSITPAGNTEAIPLLNRSGVPVYLSVTSNSIGGAPEYVDISCSESFSILRNRKVILYDVANKAQTRVQRSRAGEYSTYHDTNTYMVFPPRNRVGVLPIGATRVQTILRVGTNPWTIGIQEVDGTYLGYVPNRGSGNLSVLSLTPFQVIAPILEVGTAPTDITFGDTSSIPVIPSLITSSGGTEENTFIAEEEFVNIIRWELPTPEPNLVAYHVWRNGTQKVGTVKAGDVGNEGLYEIHSHNCKKGEEYWYSIRGLDANGNLVAFGTLYIKTGG